MKAQWLDSEKERNRFIKNYAAVIPENADYMTVTDDDGDICGFAAITVRYNSSDIEFLIIEEEKRGQGYGSFLLENVERALGILGTEIIRCILPPGGDVTEFFTRAGYRLYEGEAGYGVLFSSLHYSYGFRKEIEEIDPVEARTISHSTSSERKLISAILKEDGYTESRSSDINLSSFVCHKGVIEAVLLIETSPGTVHIKYMYAENDTKYLTDCFRASCRQILALHGRDRDLKLAFSAGDKQGLEFLTELTGDLVIPEKLPGLYIAVKEIL
ncbi:MAG: GNAT family N-acetyltransferase [Butyrivibrio sp.]|nr:GNAT family N-acetyltransferase [Butyrivibrio sp.]